MTFTATQATKTANFLPVTRYSEGEGPEDSGSIVASYKGQHGWYWLNIADQPVILELEVAGFYDKIISVSTEY